MKVSKLRKWRNKVVSLLVTAFLIPVMRIYFLEDAIQKGPELAIVLVLGVLGVSLLIFEGRIRRRLKLQPKAGVEEIPNETPLRHAARELAAGVKGQWEKEAKRRGLASEPPLMQIGWSVDPERTQEGPIDDVGDRLSTGDPRTRSVDSLAELFQTIGPSRTLVVLGAGESGKSAAAVILTLGLLKGRSEGAPVPVLFSLASWDPALRLSDWLKRRLVEDYPWLRAKEDYGEDAAGELLRGGLVLPILDGLDEIPKENRAGVITAIKDSSLPLPGLALTCRIEEYEDVERRTPLRGAVVVRLARMTPGQASRYLRNAESPKFRARWDRVLNELRANPAGPLASALSSPLMVTLAHEVYQAADSQPDELLNLGDRAATEAYLLEAFLAVVFPARADPDRTGGRWRVADARRWLGQLAAGMERRNDTELRWWDVSAHARPVTSILAGLVAAATAMLSVGLAVSVLFDPRVGVVVGGAVAIALGVICAANKPPKPSEIQVKLTGNLLSALISGLTIAVIVTAIGTVVRGAAFGLAAGPVFGLPIGVLYGLTKPDATPREMNPRFLLRRDLYVGLTYGAAYGLPATVVGWLISHDAVLAAALGVGCALAGGLLYGPIWVLALRSSKVGVVAFVHLALAILWFAPQRKLPWRLMEFLEDAHELGVLRQVGGVYQFRHGRLQKALAEIGASLEGGRPAVPGTQTRGN